jgi:Cytochrome c
MHTRRLLVASIAALTTGLAGGASGQHMHGGAGAPATAPPGIKISMDELHRAGGVPPGWRFSWPSGDAQKGREVFARLECYQCHEVKGESFPAVPPDPSRRGPALSEMGSHHPAEYFAESIINPNAVVVTGPGHTGPDGLSIMPDYRDSLTLADTIDLVAYIRSLGGDEHEHHATMASGPQEQTVGAYRVRLVYQAPGNAGEPRQEHGGMMHQPGGAPTAAPSGHLMVFVSDATTGEPVPYLPVSATLRAAGGPRLVRLTPMFGGKGFHYGADVTVPDTTTKISVAIGRPTVPVMPNATAGLVTGVHVTFDWGK